MAVQGVLFLKSNDNTAGVTVQWAVEAPVVSGLLCV